MKIVELVAEGDTVVARSTCSATHTNVWLGHLRGIDGSTGCRRFYFFGFTWRPDQHGARGLEDTSAGST